MRSNDKLAALAKVEHADEEASSDSDTEDSEVDEAENLVEQVDLDADVTEANNTQAD